MKIEIISVGIPSNASNPKRTILTRGFVASTIADLIIESKADENIIKTTIARMAYTICMMSLPCA